MDSPAPSDRQALIRRLLAFIAPFRKQLTLGLLCSAVSAAALPIALKQLTDFLGRARAAGTQTPALLADVTHVGLTIVGAYTGLLLFRFFQGLFLSEVAQRVGMGIRSAVFTHLQRMPLSFFHSQRTGALLATLTNDVNRLQNAAMLLRDGVVLPVQALLYLGTMLWSSLEMAVVTLVAVPLMVGVIHLITKKLRALSTESQNRLAEATSILSETLSAPRVVQAFSAEEREVARFNQANDGAFQAAMRGIRRTSLLTPTVDWIGAVALALILYAGVYFRVPTDRFLMFVAMANLLANSISGFGNVRGQFEELLGAADRIFTQVLDVVPSIRDADNATELPPLSGRIVFEDVSFGYAEDKPVLSQVSLTIEPGEVVAFVGPTGAGKSTLADLIPRFNDPTCGRVLVDGVDIRTVTIASLRQQIGIVPQDSILFSGTIASNIAYGKPGATEQEITAAACAANAHDFIQAQADGYQTVVGERGTTLSGGQKQRLAIARALLTNPHILIFDEATSALDTQTESVVQEALGTWFKGRTTLIIAHRLSTIVNADKIVVLQEGKIAEVGTHTELLATGGLYSLLYNAQQRGLSA
ncbi:ABC transporter ATP-binding protein [Armatimonas rosea]|uniref:Subfamily B ATP-binding cassette protein MsbA n=1 Tax=Armatimonas rosea TaxID=685828 RepID=A0A7W9STG9_ARMRO|nr:ABC transporter ATP-binding protein [Armatimonas rosea]MBB6052013.1 subfamily B ATP-binding cassette protein MsbA [Armatimonas rosea]